MKGIFLLLLSLSILPTAGADPAAEAAEHHRDLQSEGEGIAIAVVKGDTTTFGVAGRLRQDGPPVGEDILFEIGSITKVFTGILLADAVLRGDAALEDPIAKHLPSDLLPPDSPLREVTLLDLATHTSGLPRLPSNLEIGASPLDPYAHYGVEQLLDFLRGCKPTDLEGRGTMSYSNLGMGLLGYLLERISGQPYQTLLRERILDPLSMSDTFVQRKSSDLAADQAPRFATGHSGGKEVPHWHIDSLAGAGAIVSSARDLARFAAAHWSEATPPSLRRAMDLAAQPQRGEIGLAWFVGQTGLHHEGGTGGFRSELQLSPQGQTATIRLLNGTGPAPDSGSEGDFTALTGIWEGVLDTGSVRLRQVVRISPIGRVVLHSVDQGGQGLPADRVIHENGVFRAVFGAIGGRLEAGVDGDSLKGIWKQSGELPLTLRRAKNVPPALEQALEPRWAGNMGPLAGWWSGFIGGQGGLFLILEIEAIGQTGEARIYSPDQTPEAIPVSHLSWIDDQLKLEVTPIAAIFTAKRNAAGQLEGQWTQGGFGMPLELIRSSERPRRP
jgi:CubicO group peptidase (beta-lactamase class C family)